MSHAITFDSRLHTRFLHKHALAPPIGRSPGIDEWSETLLAISTRLVVLMASHINAGSNLNFTPLSREAFKGMSSSFEMPPERGAVI